MVMEKIRQAQSQHYTITYHHKKRDMKGYYRLNSKHQPQHYVEILSSWFTNLNSFAELSRVWWGKRVKFTWLFHKEWRKESHQYQEHWLGKIKIWQKTLKKTAIITKEEITWFCFPK